MPCPYHLNLCNYPEWRADRCSFCHSSWTKITAPGVFGYGEKPLNHLWRHAADRASTDAARLAAKRRAA